ncbi:MAG: helix-turn-helix domain-containing protein [Lachnospiraceae bacterium]|nr:helix-turn-helix domain-containing protein [Lachnospiraceae bacterium]
MGRKSIKENKNVYQVAREKLELTRDQAAEKLQYISADRIEKIESEKVIPHPEEVLTMGQTYAEPGLWNYYCTNECPIGMKHIRKVERKELSQITIEMLAALNDLEEDKDRMVEISVDGKVTEDEKKDFIKISKELDEIASVVASLKLWVEHAILEGKMN